MNTQDIIRRIRRLLIVAAIILSGHFLFEAKQSYEMYDFHKGLIGKQTQQSSSYQQDEKYEKTLNSLIVDAPINMEISKKLIYQNILLALGVLPMLYIFFSTIAYIWNGDIPRFITKSISVFKRK